MPTIEVINDKENFLGLKQEWNQLFANAENVTIFQTFQYNWIAWNTFSGAEDNLHIIVCRDGNKEIVAIFPFYVDRKKRLRFINDIHTDFCNILLRGSYTTLYNLMHEVWECINSDKKIKTLFLDNLIPQSPIASFWETLSINGFVFSQTEHTWFDCPKSEDIIKNLTNFERKDRHRVNKILKKTQECELIFYRKSQHPYPEKITRDLIDAMVKSGMRSYSYFNPKMLKFMRDLYDNGLVEIPVLFEKSNPVALEFIFVNTENDFCMHWVIMYLDARHNLWFNLRFLTERTKEFGFRNDFGRGGYDYKMQNFRPQIENLYRFMYSKTIWGNWYILFKMTASHLRKTLKRYRKQ